MHTTNLPTSCPKRKIDKFSPKERRVVATLFHVLLLSLFFVKVPKKRSPRKRPIAWPSSGASTLFFTKGGTPYRPKTLYCNGFTRVAISDRPSAKHFVSVFFDYSVLILGATILVIKTLRESTCTSETAPHFGH